MPVYTVHAPVSVTASRASGETADRYVFIRDGFYVWAMIMPVVWMLWHRLWLALIGYVVLTVAVGFALAKLDAGSGTGLVVMSLFAILIGLEAASLRRRKLSRGTWRQLDVVVADDQEAAERRFFDRYAAHLGTQPSFANNWVDRGPQAPTAYQGTASKDIIGLFPQGGGSR